MATNMAIQEDLTKFTHHQLLTMITSAFQNRDYNLAFTLATHVTSRPTTTPTEIFCRAAAFKALGIVARPTNKGLCMFHHATCVEILDIELRRSAQAGGFPGNLDTLVNIAKVELVRAQCEYSQEIYENSLAAQEETLRGRMVENSGFHQGPF